MKLIYAAFLMVFITIIGFGCQREVDYSLSNNGNNNNNNPAGPIKTTLQGNVVDENGRPAAGVTIKAGGQTVSTDARGYFRVWNATLSKNASLVSAEKNGYFRAFRTFSATSGVNQVMIKLIKKKLAGKVNATSGGSVTLSNGARVTLPGAGVMQASNSQVYTGEVNVYSAYIDPTANDIGTTLPGSLLATDKDNKQVLLESYGMMAVELESTAGVKLQVASGKSATLVMPIPASLQSSAPSSISLWYVDEQTGLWKEEGTATKSGDAYTGEVKHFTYWNCDVPGPTVTLSAIFLAPQGLPLVNAEVVIKATNWVGGTAHGYTDSLGHLHGPIPANRPLVIQLIDPCGNVLYSQNIGPFSAAANLGTITLPANVNSSLVVVKGKLLDCSNSAVTKGYAMVYFNNMVHYAQVNAQGAFETTFTKCQSSPTTCEILGVDQNSSQQGVVTTIALIPPVTNAGNISACGTSSLEFINYTLDLTPYVISSTQTDSLMAYPNGTGIPFTLQIFGGNNATNYISYHFNCDGTAGVFPMQGLRVHQFETTIIQPMNVTLTKYPQTVGQYYEGNFSGQFRYINDPAITHDINGSFRLRRNQ